tara:strand:- start:21 stop:407 length:387 start_codon:yes stop_codon:yes gene_type:complete
MLENKNKETIKEMKQTLEEFADHMYVVSDGMQRFQKDLGVFARELNMIKSYVEVLVGVLDKKGIISSGEVKELVSINIGDKVKEIQKDITKYETTMKNETDSIKHLIEKFKSSIVTWFDEDGNPIAKA